MNRDRMTEEERDDWDRETDNTAEFNRAETLDDFLRLVVSECIEGRG